VGVIFVLQTSHFLLLAVWQMSFDNHRASAMDGASSSGNPEATSQAAPSVPLLCRTGCGFYASVAFDGMCSKCYKETVDQATSSSATSPTPTVSSRWSMC